MKKIVALLPMKGTSERVPNKNLKLFNGKPLYHIILETLLKSKYIEEVVVNTDSEFLKSDILLNYNEKVTVVDRNEDVCGNYVSMNKVLEQDINIIESEIYIQTHSTNPLLKVETIDNALEKMLKILEDSSQNDSVFSVSKVQKRFYNEDSTPMNHDPGMLVTQHLAPIFEENSCFYIFTKKSFLNNDSRIGLKPFMYEIDKIESTDIDEPEDFIIAEALHKLLR
ncbi:MAG: acylneuraminate cytidylyltransferase family protein [Algibacter sp.]